MTVKVRVKRLEAARIPRPRRTWAVVGIEDKAAGTVTVGEKVMTAAEFEALPRDRILLTKREEVKHDG